MKRILCRCLLILILVSVLVLSVLTVQSIKQCETELTVVHYELETELTESIRIVQLTDLHSHVFGTDNDILAALVLQQNPDLVVMTGDMMDKQDENADVVCSLIRQLSSHVPVWYGYGNHESEWMDQNGEDLTPVLEEAGAHVLDCSFQDLQLKNQQIRLGGYHGYYRQPGMYEVTPEQRQAELDFAQAFENTQRFKLLLCHIPTAWLDWEYINRFPVDLVLTGHYHGGQIRIPYLGGLYAPYIGLFPEYTEGIYIGQTAACVLSRGLGSSPGIPRINNLPELTVIDLIPKQ